MNSSNSSKKRGSHTIKLLLQNFHVNNALKMSLTVIIQLYVISVKYGTTLNVTISIILITNTYKVVTNHGIASLSPQCSSPMVI